MSRSKRRTTATGIIRQWRSEDYLVAEVKSLYGLPTVYLVIEQLSNGNQVIRSRHRKREAARRQLERFERLEA